MRAFEPSEAERPRDVDQRRRCFGGEPAAPEGPGDPVAELDRSRRAPAEAAGAGQLRCSVRPFENQEGRQHRVARLREKGFGVAEAIRPGRGREIADDHLVGNR